MHAMEAWAVRVGSRPGSIGWLWQKDWIFRKLSPTFHKRFMWRHKDTFSTYKPFEDIIQLKASQASKVLR